MRAARAGPKPLTVATNELGPEPRPPLSKHALDFVKAKDKPTSRVKESDMPAWELTLGSTPILNAVPSFLASEDLNEPEGDAEPIIRYWEALLRKHGHHPYLLVRYAERLMVLSDAGHALVLLEECLEEMGALDAEVSPEFEASVEALREHLDTKTLHTDGNLPDPSLVQLWIPAAMLPMPSDALAPGGHAQVRSDWTQDFPKGSEALRYMRHLAVETHQVDRTFLITEESMKDIVQDGIAAHRIHVASGSKIQDPHVIDAILDDTLTAYELVCPLVEDPAKLTPEAICEIHQRMMDTARFQSEYYFPAGVMRSATRNEVFIETGRDKRIQCCPSTRVEDEMHKICDMARRHIEEDRMSPFAQAVWLHLAQVRCIPFEKGNGQVLRMISSIPLMRRGYPPISVLSHKRNAYFEAINQAYKGNFDPLARCFVEGMQKGIEGTRP